MQQRGGIEASPPASQQPGRTLEYVQPTGLPSKPSDVYPQPTIPANWLEDQVNEAGPVSKAAPTEETQQSPEKKLNDLTKNQAEARKKVDEFEASMAAAAAAVGPMTPEQYQAFCNNYKNEKGAQALYDNLENANQALASHFQENKEALLKAAATDSDTAQKVYDAMNALAKSPQSAVVLETSQAIYAEQGSALSAAFQGDRDLRKIVIPQAVGQEYAKYLEKHNGDGKAALQEIMGTINGLKGAYSNAKEFKEGFELLQQIGQGNYKALEKYGSGATSNDKLSPTFKLFISLGSLAAAATSAGTKDEAYVIGLIKAGLDTGSISAGLLGSHLKSLAEAGKHAALGKSAKVIDKFSKILGATSGLLGSIIDTLKYDKYNSNGGDFMALVGSYIGTFASFIGAIPGAQGVAAIMGLVGLGLSTGGELLSNALNQEQREKALRAAGVDDRIVRAMAAHGPELAAMMNTLGLDPAKLQKLLIENPEIGGSKGSINAFTLAATSCGISKDLVLDFAKKLREGNPDFMNALSNIHQDIQFFNPASRDRFMRDFIANNISGMKSFLQEKSQVYSESQQARDDARIDYQNTPFMNEFQFVTSVADLLNKNSSPEYRGEIIRQIVDSGMFDFFIDQMNSHPNRETYRQAILEALDLFSQSITGDDALKKKIAQAREKLGA